MLSSVRSAATVPVQSTTRCVGCGSKSAEPYCHRPDCRDLQTLFSGNLPAATLALRGKALDWLMHAASLSPQLAHDRAQTERLLQERCRLLLSGSFISPRGDPTRLLCRH